MNYVAVIYKALDWKRCKGGYRARTHVEPEFRMVEAGNPIEAIDKLWDERIGGETPLYGDHSLGGKWLAEDGTRAGIQDRASEIGIEVRVAHDCFEQAHRGVK